jgi:hypothetical protein
MGKLTKRLLSGVLAFALCVVATLGVAVTGKAAEPQYDAILDEYGTATANVAVSHNISVDTNEGVLVELAVLDKTPTATVGVYDSTGSLYTSQNIVTSNWELDTEYTAGTAYYVDLGISEMPAGDYTVRITFDADVTYVLYVVAAKPAPTLNMTKATVSVGFKKTLKVDNTTEKITWSTNKKSVATVSQKGVVTGKKAGTATITATTASGQKLTCKVTVKANAYTEKKVTASNVYYGDGVFQVYKASYASNGDLVLKCRFINKCGYKVNKLTGIKVTFKTAAGKTIGTYSAKSKSMTVAHGESKDFTLTIKKSKLKIKNADLRNASYTNSGQYEYRY